MNGAEFLVEIALLEIPVGLGGPRAVTQELFLQSLVDAVARFVVEPVTGLEPFDPLPQGVVGGDVVGDLDAGGVEAFPPEGIVEIVGAELGGLASDLVPDGTV